jgi:hypothetical protein
LACALLAVGCGDRSLELRTSMASSCVVNLPRGGSILYEVLVSDPSGTSRGVCGACLPVDSPLNGSTALLDQLRASAPPCRAIVPGATLTMRVNGWSVAMCPAPGGAATNSPVLCASSKALVSPDGRSDGALDVVLTCDAACNQGCVPLTCFSQNRMCGQTPDGCGGLLDCGTCHGNQVCQQQEDGFRCR